MLTLFKKSFNFLNFNFPQDVVKKRQQNDLFRRKNYEIKTLKENLCQTEQDLYEKEKKLRSIETSLVRGNAFMYLEYFES